MALGLGAWFHRREVPRRVWLLGALCASAPDLDVLGFHAGVAYGDLLGHRGLTHSIPFAAAVAGALVGLGFPRGVPGLTPGRLWLYLFAVIASHGLLDAMTTGGLGVAFLAPFDASRHFLPFRPIRVSPIGIRPFLGERGLAILANELVWVWIPSLLLGGLALAWRRRRAGREGG